MPPLISVVDVSILGNNTSLVSLELPETAELLEDNHDEDVPFTDLSVRNIALPLECVTDTIAIKYCAMLGLALMNDDDDDDDDDYSQIIVALQNRFDDLPIHKICYYQSYYDNETTMQHLKREINPWTSKFPGQLNTTGKEKDCLGMTPLHILACSTKPTIAMFQLLIEKYPETLIMKDKWGDIPLLYAFWCNAPTEVLVLLVESYKSLHPDYEFDWKGTIKILVRHNVPLMRIQTLVNTQQNSFSDQKYDMQQIVMELASLDATQYPGFGYPYTSVNTVKYLLRVSITKRLDSLGVSRWCVDLENSINNLRSFFATKNIQPVYDRLAVYESIKEGTSVLEMALWKAKIDESRNKKARVDGKVNYRDQCRVSCGADIVIRNVLPFLLPE